MAGFIVLDDGRAYAAAGWAFRDTIRAIASALPNHSEGIALAHWLTNDPIVQVYLTVDVRGLARRSREMFLTAIPSAFKSQIESGPTLSDEGRLWQEWIERFRDLVKMVECVQRGEPPNEFNPHMIDVVPMTFERYGPGWN